MWLWWYGFAAIVKKEILQTLRNKTRLRMLLLFQCLDFAMLVGIDVTVREVPAVLVDQDHTDESRALVERISATGTFDLKYATTSTDQARDHIRAGRARVAIVIPPDYGRVRQMNGDAHLLALLDGSDSASSGQAAASLQGVASRLNLEAQQEVVEATATTTPHAVLLFNPQGSLSSFMLPGLLALILAESYAVFAMRSLAGERDAGNLERLLMTPMSHAALIFGKLIPWFLLGVANGVLYLLVSRFAFGVPIRGSVMLLFFALSLYVLTEVTLGAFIAAGAESAGDAQGTLFYMGFPVFWLSGYIFPLASLPKVLLPVSYALPETHFIEIMRGICLRGADATELAPHLLYFAIAPIVLTVGSIWRFSRSIMS
jgi:ABC-2 type transport system permease protein